MADIHIQIFDKEAKAYFDRAPDKLDAAVRGMLEDGSTYFLAEMTRYPAARPGSTYRRTRTLGRSWSRKPVVRTSSGWRVVIGSNGSIAPYNRYVQDRTRQARIHRGRWRTAQDAAEQSASRIQGFANARIRMALEAR